MSLRDGVLSEVHGHLIKMNEIYRSYTGHFYAKKVTLDPTAMACPVCGAPGTVYRPSVSRVIGVILCPMCEHFTVYFD